MKDEDAPDRDKTQEKQTWYDIGDQEDDEEVELVEERPAKRRRGPNKDEEVMVID